MILHCIDIRQHHFEERAVFAGCGVIGVGTNESNMYRRTERNTWFSECESLESIDLE